jgi:hypothetical protein
MLKQIALGFGPLAAVLVPLALVNALRSEPGAEEKPVSGDDYSFTFESSGIDEEKIFADVERSIEQAAERQARAKERQARAIERAAAANARAQAARERAEAARVRARQRAEDASRRALD